MSLFFVSSTFYFQKKIPKLNIFNLNFQFKVSRTESYSELAKKPPPNKLMAFRPIFSLLGHMAIILAIQVFTFFYVKWQPWFEAYEDSSNKREKNFASYENTAVFTVSMFQYLTEAVIFSKGAPYRRSIFSNFLFMSILILLLIMSLIISLAPIIPIYEFLTLRLIPDIKFRMILVGISLLHFFLAFIFESYVIDSDFLANYSAKRKSSKLSLEDEDKMKCYPKRAANQTPYQKIEFEIRKKPHWPPITPAENAITSTNQIAKNQNGINEKLNNSIDVLSNSLTSEKLNSLSRNSSSKKRKTSARYDDHNFEMNTQVNHNNNSVKTNYNAKVRNDSETFDEFTKI